MRFFAVQFFIFASIVGNSFEQNPRECGVQKITIKELITHGYDTYPGQFPWHVAIFHYKSSVKKFGYACGGSLVSSTFVLTAKHCTRDVYSNEIRARGLKVYLGINDINQISRNYPRYGVKTIHIVPLEGRWEKLKNDIALLELETNVQFTDYVQPICLNVLKKSKLKTGVIVGWGRTENQNESETLKAATMPIISHTECLMSNRISFGSTLDPGMICAGYLNGTGVSNGDSGGGLVVQRCFASKCSWSLAGIVSFTAGNAKGTIQSEGYGVFTDVQMYLPWIEKITNMTFEDDVSDGFCSQRQNASLQTKWSWHGTLYRVDSRPLIAGYPVREGFGVTIISDQFVVTAVLVYRIVVLAPEDYRLRFGRSATGDSSKYTQNMPIEAVYIESVTIDNKEVYQDMALLKLKGRLTFTKYIQPICLWKVNDLIVTSIVLQALHKIVEAIGGSSVSVKPREHELSYFLTLDKTTGYTSRTEIIMHIIPIEFCDKEKKLSIVFNGLFICGQTKELTENDPKYWDIGTGLVVQNENRWFLRGIYSNGYNGHFKPTMKDNHTMFLNVLNYYDSIVFKIDTYSFSYDD